MFQYYIFRFMNMKKPTILDISEQIAKPLEAVSSAQRIAILLAIGRGEACVCHLEALLGWRQAYISQHLMALRKADILEDRREGRYVFYRLKHPSTLDLMATAAAIGGLHAQAVTAMIDRQAFPACECPHCTPALAQTRELKSA